MNVEPAGTTGVAAAELVRLDAIGKSYGPLVVLKDVNLKVRTGEVLWPSSGRAGRARARCFGA